MASIKIEPGRLRTASDSELSAMAEAEGNAQRDRDWQSEFIKRVCEVYPKAKFNFYGSLTTTDHVNTATHQQQAHQGVQILYVHEKDCVITLFEETNPAARYRLVAVTIRD